MSYPLMNKRSRQGVVIPELAGGMNLRDSVSMVADNQLTDAVNVWYKDGVLKTRPGYLKNNAEFNITAFPLDDIDTASSKPENVYMSYNGLRYQLYSCFLKRIYQTTLENEDGEIEYIDVVQRRLKFIWISSEDEIDIPAISPNSDIEYFTVQHKDKVYCFTSECKIYVYTVNEEDPKHEWSELTEEDIYAPLIATNYYASGADGSAVANTDIMFSGATMVDGFNLLGHRYRLIGSTIPADFVYDFENTSPMSYLIPYSGKEGAWELVPTVLKVSITQKNTGELITHTVTGEPQEEKITADVTYTFYRYYESDLNTDGLQMRVTRYDEHIIIDFLDSSGAIAGLVESDHLENNMEIIAPIENSKENYNKVFGMTRAEWFGGASVGINGGTRLFLGGNTNAEESGLVIWSGLNEPLYFSENCYAYVGNPTQPVTAFGKQSDMLVIFKENETYFTRYTQNDSITADELIDQSVVDYTASSVYFPLTQINAHIGCDCPDTVQLCRNRLVWTNSNGKVYTLVTNNQYSERNIYEIGEMIERRLSEEKKLKSAFSADWEGHYMLQCGNRTYLMDYNSNGFQYAYSYQKNEDANARIPWYYWELDNISSLSGNIVLLSGLDKPVIADCNIYGYSSSAEIYLYKFDAELSTDSGSPIHTSLTTKLFDFGAGGYRKNIEQVTLMLGNNGGAPIKVGFVTDCGTEEEEITLDGDETAPYTAGFISAVPLYPCIRSVLRFGVKLSCEGTLALDGMTLNYRILGGAR